MLSSSQRFFFFFTRAPALKQNDSRIQRQNSFTIRLVSQKSVEQQRKDFFFFLHARRHSNKTTYASKTNLIHNSVSFAEKCCAAANRFFFDTCALKKNDLHIQRQISFTIRLVLQKSVEQQRTDFLFTRAHSNKTTYAYKDKIHSQFN